MAVRRGMTRYFGEPNGSGVNRTRSTTLTGAEAAKNDDVRIIEVSGPNLKPLQPSEIVCMAKGQHKEQNMKFTKDNIEKIESEIKAIKELETYINNLIGVVKLDIFIDFDTAKWPITFSMKLPNLYAPPPQRPINLGEFEARSKQFSDLFNKINHHIFVLKELGINVIVSQSRNNQTGYNSISCTYNATYDYGFYNNNDLNETER